MKTQEDELPRDVENLKEIPKWTRTYAQNRTIPFLVGLVINACLFAGITIPSYFVGKAYATGNMVLVWVCVVTLVVAMMSLVFLCVPRWNAPFVERITRRLYKAEGDVFIAVPGAKGKKQLTGAIVGFVFAGCILGSALLGVKGHLYSRYALKKLKGLTRVEGEAAHDV